MNSFDLRLIRLTLATIWLVTGVVSIVGYPKQESFDWLARVGLQGSLALMALMLASALDIFFAVLTLLAHSKRLWLIQAAVIVVYTLIISIWLPEFWRHPFGPVLKNLPVLLLLWLLYTHGNAEQ